MSRYNLKKSAHDEGAVPEKIPQGYYTFQITDFKEINKKGEYFETKNGDPMILIICEVVGSKENGKSMLHSVIFYQPDSPSIKGIGLTRNFLKCIGQPHEGDIDANPDNWIGKKFQAEVIHNGEYANLTDIQPAVQDKNSKVVPTNMNEEIAWDEDVS